ncbi:MAG: hypothetical protein HY548_01520, partial [Elusimicrobia bacterium]|nr:hypothetical protein [Elusimicrobiota bacterium]
DAAGNVTVYTLKEGVDTTKTDWQKDDANWTAITEGSFNISDVNWATATLSLGVTSNGQAIMSLSVDIENAAGEKIGTLNVGYSLGKDGTKRDQYLSFSVNYTGKTALDVLMRVLHIDPSDADAKEQLLGKINGLKIENRDDDDKITGGVMFVVEGDTVIVYELTASAADPRVSVIKEDSKGKAVLWSFNKNQMDWDNATLTLGVGAGGKAILSFAVDIIQNGQVLGRFSVGFDTEKGTMNYYLSDLKLTDSTIRNLVTKMLGFDPLTLTPEKLSDLLKNNDAFVKFLSQALGMKVEDVLKLDAAQIKDKLVAKIGSMGEADLKKLAGFLGVSITDFDKIKTELEKMLTGDLSSKLADLAKNDPAKLRELAKVLGIENYETKTNEELVAAIKEKAGKEGFLDSLKGWQIEFFAKAMGMDLKKFELSPTALRENLSLAVGDNPLSYLVRNNKDFADLVAGLLGKSVHDVKEMDGEALQEALDGILALDANALSALLKGSPELLQVVAKLLKVDVEDLKGMGAEKAAQSLLWALAGFLGVNVHDIEALKAGLQSMINNSAQMNTFVESLDSATLQWLAGLLGIDISRFYPDVEEDEGLGGRRGGYGLDIKGLREAVLAALPGLDVSKLSPKDLEKLSGLLHVDDVISSDKIKTLLKEKIKDMPSFFLEKRLNVSASVWGFIEKVFAAGGRVDFENATITIGLSSDGKKIMEISADVLDAKGVKLASLSISWDNENAGFSYYFKFKMDNAVTRQFLMDLVGAKTMQELVVALDKYALLKTKDGKTITYSQLLAQMGGDIDFMNGELILGTNGAGEVVVAANFDIIKKSTGEKIGTFNVVWDDKEKNFGFQAEFDRADADVNRVLNTLETAPQGTSGQGAPPKPEEPVRDDFGTGDEFNKAAYSAAMAEYRKALSAWESKYGGGQSGQTGQPGTDAVPFGQVDYNTGKFVIGATSTGNFYMRNVYDIIDENGQKVGDYTVGAAGNKDNVRLDNYSSYDLNNVSVQSAVDRGVFGDLAPPTLPEDVGVLDMSSAKLLVGIVGGDTVVRIVVDILDEVTGEVIGQHTEGKVLTETQGWQVDDFSTYDLSKNAVKAAVADGRLELPSPNTGFGASGFIPPPPPERPRINQYYSDGGDRFGRDGDGRGEFDREAYEADMAEYEKALDEWQTKYGLTPGEWREQYKEKWDELQERGESGTIPVDPNPEVGIERDGEGTLTTGTMAGKEVNSVQRNIYDPAGNKIGTHTYGIVKGLKNNSKTYNLASSYVQMSIRSGRLAMP